LLFSFPPIIQTFKMNSGDREGRKRGRSKISKENFSIHIGWEGDEVEGGERDFGEEEKTIRKHGVSRDIREIIRLFNPRLLLEKIDKAWRD